MARFEDFSITVVLLLSCCSLLVAAGLGLADEEIAPFAGIELPSDDTVIAPAPELIYEEPEDRFVMPPEPEPGFYEYLDNCTAKMTDQCGHKIVLVLIEKDVLSNDCCEQLVLMGKRCHEDLVKTAAAFPENQAIASKIYQMGSKIWNECVILVGEDASSPALSS